MICQGDFWFSDDDSYPAVLSPVAPDYSPITTVRTQQPIRYALHIKSVICIIGCTEPTHNLVCKDLYILIEQS